MRFTDGATLTWAAVNGAVAYHVYRGTLANVAAPGSGLCLDDRDADPTDLQFVDVDLPSSGAGLFYLVTSEDDAGGEATPGASTCRDRSGFTDCPAFP